MPHKNLWGKTVQVTIVVWITLLSHKSQAEIVTETPQFTKCMNDVDLGAFKNTQWGACYESELIRQDKRLELEYKKLQGDYKKVDKQLLNAAKKLG
jgi:hypothetical protein